MAGSVLCALSWGLRGTKVKKMRPFRIPSKWFHEKPYLGPWGRPGKGPRGLFTGWWGPDCMKSLLFIVDLLIKKMACDVVWTANGKKPRAGFRAVDLRCCDTCMLVGRTFWSIHWTVCVRGLSTTAGFGWANETSWSSSYPYGENPLLIHAGLAFNFPDSLYCPLRPRNKVQEKNYQEYPFSYGHGQGP